MNIELLLVVAALVVAGLLVSKLGFERRRLPRGVELLLGTGTPFVFVGFAIGPSGLHVVSADFFEQLEPIVILGFGWIGFLYGTHFELRRLRRFRRGLYLGAFTESLVVLGVVAGAAWGALPYLVEALTEPARLAVSAGLGICAAGTAPAGIFALLGGGGVRRADVDVLQFFAAMDDLPPVVLLGLGFAVLAPSAAFSDAALLAFLAAIALGAVLGLLSHWFLPGSRELRKHAFVIILGMASLCAGAATMLGLSPLFVAVVGGAVFANLSPRKEDIYGLMARRESTLYAVFLIVAGSQMRLEASPLMLVMVPAYVIVRAAAKVLGARLGVLVAGQPGTHPWLGLGLLFQGGLGLVIAVQLDHWGGVPGSRLFLTIVALAVVLNDLLGAPLAYRVLRRGR